LPTDPFWFSKTEKSDMLSADETISDWLQLVRSEYLEMPGLHLTKPQVERMWGLDPLTSEVLLQALVDDGFLRRTRAHAYVRADAGRR
jgi:hypothetical protein